MDEGRECRWHRGAAKAHDLALRQQLHPRLVRQGPRLVQRGGDLRCRGCRYAGTGATLHQRERPGEKNIHFKFTSINLDIFREANIPAAQVLRRAADTFGADRLMWGSDIGAASGTYQDMVQRFLDAVVVLSPAKLRAVAHDTGKRVFVKGGVNA